MNTKDLAKLGITELCMMMINNSSVRKRWLFLSSTTKSEKQTPMMTRLPFQQKNMLITASSAIF